MRPSFPSSSTFSPIIVLSLSLLFLSLPSSSLSQSCFSGPLPGYPLLPDPPLLSPLAYRDPSTQSTFYFSPCGTVDTIGCSTALGQTSQLCEIPPQSRGPPVNLISFDISPPSYDSPAFNFTLTPDGVDLNTEDGDVCQSDPTRKYNVTIHFQCDSTSTSSDPNLVEISHNSDDYCQVEGVVTGDAYCELYQPLWTSTSVCQYGPYDYSSLSEGGDMVQFFADTNSNLYFHPCGYVREDACYTKNPNASLCNVTTHLDGTTEVTILAAWNGNDYEWKRQGEWTWTSPAIRRLSYNEVFSVQRLPLTSHCSPVRPLSDSTKGLQVNWQCDPTAFVAELDAVFDPSPFELGRSSHCYYNIRVRMASMCIDDSSSTGNGPYIGSSSPLSPSDGSSTGPFTPPLSTSAQMMWSSSYLTLAIICASVLLCLFYFAIPQLTRRLQKAHRESLPRIALPNPCAGLAGEGGMVGVGGKMGVSVEGMRREEGLAKPLLNLDDYGAGGEWFVAPARQ